MVFAKSCSTCASSGRRLFHRGTMDARVDARRPREARGTKMSDATPAASKEQQRPSFWGRGAYELFLETEGIPVYTGVAVNDMRKAELAKWPRLDARGAYVRLIGAEDTDNAYIIELDATKS